MNPTTVGSGSTYRFTASDPLNTATYLHEPVLQICREVKAKRVLDLGCGNGSLCRTLNEAGFQMTGIDPSESGIMFARENLPNGSFRKMGVYDDPADLGESDFDVVVSLEVVEHLYSPHHLPEFANRVLKPGGTLIVSTPYHGYLKNLVISLTNKWDFHHTSLHDDLHIKFWSPKTLTKLLTDQGFILTRFIGAGRVPYLWRSMILVVQKPQ